MAYNISLRILAHVGFVFAFLLQGILGKTVCENLGQDTCAFAVSSTGKRCVLEKHVKRTGEEAFACKTSLIEASDNLKDHIETQQCIKDCGLDRKSLGISSDSLLDSHFTQKLCSPQCYGSCPNVVDLYFNLAAGEGVFLPKLCEAHQGVNSRRGMAEIRSSGIVAPGPVSFVKLAATSPESYEHPVVAPGPVSSVELAASSEPYEHPVVAPRPVSSVEFSATAPEPYEHPAVPVAEPVFAPAPY